jgi:hypothetical protein
MTRANPTQAAADDAEDPDETFLDAPQASAQAVAPPANVQVVNAGGANESEDEMEIVDESLRKCFRGLKMNKATVKFLTEDAGLCDLGALKLTLAKDVPAMVERAMLLTKNYTQAERKKIRVTPAHVIYLQGLRYWIDYCEETRRLFNLTDFQGDTLDKWVGRVREISTKLEILKADGAHIALPLWSVFNKDYRMWEQAFLSFLQTQLTTLTRAQLIVILRTVMEVTEEAKTATYASIDEDLAATTVLEGPNYRDDNNRVFAFLKESLKGSPAAFNMIQEYDRKTRPKGGIKENGREAFFHFKAQHEGTHSGDTRKRTADNVIRHNVFEGKSNYTMAAHVAKVNEAYATLANEGKFIDEEEKQDLFIRSIKDPELKIVVAALQADLTGKYRNDYQASVGYIVDQHARMQAEKKAQGVVRKIHEIQIHGDKTKAAKSRKKLKTGGGSKAPGKPHTAEEKAKWLAQAKAWKISADKVPSHIYSLLSTEQKNGITAARKGRVIDTVTTAPREEMDTEENMENLFAAEKAAEEVVEADEVVAMAEPAPEPKPAPIRKVVQFGRHVHAETAELCSVEVCTGGVQWNVVMDPMKPPPTPIIEKGPPGETQEELNARLARAYDEVRDDLMSYYSNVPMAGAYILCTEKLISPLGLKALKRSDGGRWFFCETRAFKFAKHPMWDDYPGLYEQTMDILLAQSEQPEAMAACVLFWFNDSPDPDRYAATYMEEHGLKTAADFAKHVFAKKNMYRQMITDHCTKMME